MMKQKALLTLMICSSSWLVGCDTTQTTHPFRANAFMTASAKQTNANIISDLIAVNKNEIAVSRLAEHQSTNHEVKKFAKWMVHAHRKNLEQTLMLSKKIHTPQEANAMSRHLQNEGAQEVASLNGLTGAAFDKHYIRAMVKDHEAALRLLDHTLIPQSTNAMLTKHLEATRQDVMMHLQHAQALQKQLGA